MSWRTWKSRLSDFRAKLESNLLVEADVFVAVGIGLVPLFLVVLMHLLLPDLILSNPRLDSVIDVLGAVGSALLALHMRFSVTLYRRDPYFQAALISFVAVALTRFLKSLTIVPETNAWLDLFVILLGGIPFIVASFYPSSFQSKKSAGIWRIYLWLCLAAGVSLFWAVEKLPSPLTSHGYSQYFALPRGLGDLGYLAVAARLILSKKTRTRFEYLVLGTYCLFLAGAHLLLPMVPYESLQWWLLEFFRPTPYYVALLFLYPRYLKATEEIRDREERFRLLFEFSPVGKAIIGRHYNFLQVNAALCGMLGYEPAELLEQNILALTHPDDLLITLRKSEGFFRGDISQYQLEKRFFRKSGEVVYVKKMVAKLPAKGDALHAIVVLQEITEAQFWAHRPSAEKSQARPFPKIEPQPLPI